MFLHFVDSIDYIVYQFIFYLFPTFYLAGLNATLTTFRTQVESTCINLFWKKLCSTIL